MKDILRICDKFKLSIGNIYLIDGKSIKNTKLCMNDILYDLQGNRFKVKGIEMFRAFIDMDPNDMPLGILLGLLDGVEVEGYILSHEKIELNFIYCNHPLYKDQVDEDYREEYQTAGLNSPCALFSYEDLKEGKLSLFGEKISGLTIYRGWMMKPDMYNFFYDKLEEKGIILINTPEEYKRYHTLPGWYNEFKEFTPESVWENTGTLESALDLTIGLSGSYIVKDYVKSRKHEWYDACYIQNITDTTNVKKTIGNFIERQGDSLVGGIVLRKFVKLKPIGYHEKSGMPISEEYRVFVYAGRVMIIENYWRTENKNIISDDEFTWIFTLIDKIRSNFVTMDLGRTEDGKLIVMELGDGQVSGLQEISPERFYPTFNPDYIDESTNIGFSFPPGAVIMADDPASDLDIEKARKLSSCIKTNQELAEVYARVDNKYKWVSSDVDDYDEGTEEYKNARLISDEWRYEEHKLRVKIFKILEEEGIEIPEDGQITVLAPFMEKYGYRDGRGWWVKY